MNVLFLLSCQILQQMNDQVLQLHITENRAQLFFCEHIYIYTVLTKLKNKFKICGSIGSDIGSVEAQCHNKDYLCRFGIMNKTHYHNPSMHLIFFTIRPTFNLTHSTGNLSKLLSASSSQQRPVILTAELSHVLLQDLYCNRVIYLQHDNQQILLFYCGNIIVSVLVKDDKQNKSVYSYTQHKL